ncbi:MAG TPA: DUF4259 domain-containing protein [Gemmatimonadales bacterium]|nr:DUF4259 domain-containing protein [Gemmatimonadales bacterium]
MGTWGPGTFENDEASDWVYELEEAEDTTLLREALEVVAEPEGYIEAQDAAIALAAAEVVAALAGHPAPDLPEEVEAWVASHRRAPVRELVSLSIRAVDQILADSELNDQWAETADHVLWVDRVQELRSRLEG